MDRVPGISFPWEALLFSLRFGERMESKMIRNLIRWFGFLITLAALWLPSIPVQAHGHTHVGDYELVIGFRSEPVYQGEPNGLDLSVTNRETGESVNGLEETLQAQIIFGSRERELNIEPQFGREGAYTAPVIPTEAGDYTWRIFGTIEGTPVDISMTSSPDTFSSVEPKSSVAFPAVEPSSMELSEQSAAAAGTARTALVAALVGIVLGAAGLVFGFLSLRSARRYPA